MTLTRHGAPFEERLTDRAAVAPLAGLGGARSWKYPGLTDTYREGTRSLLGRSPLCPVLIRLSSVKEL